MECAKRNFSLSRCPTYRTLGINGLSNFFGFHCNVSCKINQIDSVAECKTRLLQVTAKQKNLQLVYCFLTTGLTASVTHTKF